jgi:hypothetical protein
MALVSNDDDNDVEDMCFVMGTITWHETHIMPNLSVKMSFVPCCDNMYFFVAMFSISPHVWVKHKVPTSCLNYFTIKLGFVKLPLKEGKICLCD